MSSRSKKNGGRKRRAAKGTEGEKPEVLALIALGANWPGCPGILRSPISLAPSCMQVVLHWSRQTTVTCTAGIYSSQICSGNSCFDPDVSGAGSQPFGYDQWSNFYTRYRVLASTCRVDASTPSATLHTQAFNRFALFPSNYVTAAADFDVAENMPYSKMRCTTLVTGVNNRISNTMDTATIHGEPKMGVIAADDFEALTSTSPGQQWYWHFGCQPMDGATTTTLVINIRVSYLVQFFERQVNSMSSFTDSDARQLLRLKEKKKLLKRKDSSSLLK